MTDKDKDKAIAIEDAYHTVYYIVEAYKCWAYVLVAGSQRDYTWMARELIEMARCIAKAGKHD